VLIHFLFQGRGRRVGGRSRKYRSIGRYGKTKRKLCEYFCAKEGGKAQLASELSCVFEGFLVGFKFWFARSCDCNKATKLKAFGDEESWERFRMTSFGEGRALKLLSKGDCGFQQLTDFNDKFLSRIYPKGSSRKFPPLFLFFKKPN
jgi:hypothetical protein